MIKLTISRTGIQVRINPEQIAFYYNDPHERSTVIRLKTGDRFTVKEDANTIDMMLTEQEND